MKILEKKKTFKRFKGIYAIWNTMDDVYNLNGDYNPKRNREILIVFDDMIADIMTNKVFSVIIKELSIRCRKSNISFFFLITTIPFYYSKRS